MDYYTPEIIEQETYLIKQLFRALDMPDVIIEFEKQTPYYLNNNNYKYADIAPYDIILEEPCLFGNNCLYKKYPYMCYRNHQTMETVIEQGQPIPKYICKYERPWKNINGMPMRCNNPMCWFSHFSHHLYFVNYNI